MEKTSRRKMLLRAAAAGSAVAGLGIVSKRSTSVAEAQGHDHDVVDGPLASTTVSFGQWSTDPPLDRFPNVPPPPPRNVHLLTPNMPTIKAGGAVNLIIAGLRNVQIFEPGHQPGDINVGLTTPMTAPPGLPIINDPVGRILQRAGSEPDAARPRRGRAAEASRHVSGDLRVPVPLLRRHVRLDQGSAVTSRKQKARTSHLQLLQRQFPLSPPHGEFMW
jgi:hypothetical protein